jgi:hypothetical protein
VFPLTSFANSELALQTLVRRRSDSQIGIEPPHVSPMPIGLFAALPA